MSYIDTCRAHALRCLRRAYDAPTDEIKQRWLQVTDTWIGMLPEVQVTVEEVLLIAAGDEDDPKTLH